MGSVGVVSRAEPMGMKRHGSSERGRRPMRRSHTIPPIAHEMKQTQASHTKPGRKHCRKRGARR